MPRVRRPLIALVILVLVLVIGYTVRAVRQEHHDHPAPSPQHTLRPTTSAVSSR